MNAAIPQDDFKGDNAQLVSSISALLTIDAAGSLAPHGIGGHARVLLAAAASRLAAATAAQPDNKDAQQHNEWLVARLKRVAKAAGYPFPNLGNDANIVGAAPTILGGIALELEQAAKRAAATAAQPADPLDTPLPCDVKVGHGTHKKGTSLRTLVKRMQVLYDMAQERANATTHEPASIWTRTEDGKLTLPPGIKAVAQDAAGATGE